MSDLTDRLRDEASWYDLKPTILGEAANRIEELEAVSKMDVPNVELILKMLTESSWPTTDTRWEFVEEWCRQFIRLHKPPD